MPARGDVLRLARRLGFEPRGEVGAVVVVQADRITQHLPTAIVVPLDPAMDSYSGVPWAVPVSAVEAGSAIDQVAVVTALRWIRLDQLQPGAVGRLKPHTVRALDGVLRRVLGLP